ncbi:MAG: hypothetical protein ABI855_16505, partial [Bacteroidota bacterium]
MNSQQEKNLKAKNTALEKELNKITLELKHKNRELEIESSIERVRAVAMGMKKPGDLSDICKILFKEFQSLNFCDIRNTQILIHNDEKESFLNYDYSDFSGASVINICFNSHPKISAFINQVRKTNDAFAEMHICGDELNDWREFRKSNGELPDSRLENISSLYYYFYSIGSGAIGISIFKPITKEELEVLKRFRNVFDFAYHKYMDVSQAEAHFKEAKIEASLERVRAQAMSMRKSEELSGVSEIIFIELKSLGFAELRNTEIIINNDIKESILSYYFSDYGVTGTIEVFYKNHPTVKAWAEDMQKAGDGFAAVTISENEMAAWRKYREEIGYLPDPKLDKAKSVFYNSYSIGLGALSVSTFKSISDEQLNILERFRNVFGLAYRRYADVMLAEAQAREALIEASLERMRAVAMSMRKSEELISVSESMYKELTALGFTNIRNAQIVIKENEDELYTICEYSDYTIATIKENRYGTPPLIQQLYNELEESNDALYQREFAGKEFEDWLAWRKSITATIDSRLLKAGSVCFYLYSIGVGHLGISTFNAITNDQIKILKRFKNVFELSYRRYIDVAHAEAQAKEVQIELALERVRARTMAMQKSDELRECSLVLFEQLKNLGEPAEQISIGIYNEEGRVLELYATIYGNQWEDMGNLPIDEQIVHRSIYSAWKEKKKSLVVDLTGDELD